MDKFFKILVKKVVDFDVLQKHHEGLPEIAVDVLVIDKRLRDQQKLILIYRFSCVVSQFAIDKGKVYLFGGKFTLRNTPIEQASPVENPTGLTVEMCESVIQLFKVTFADEIGNG